jgi:general stress protein YciG
MPNQPRSSNRGFASMDPATQRAIAAKGGRAAHASGNAHEFSPAEARAAGRKGGEAISRDRQHMAAIGREGGHARHAHALQQQQQRQPQAEAPAGAPPRQQG